RNPGAFAGRSAGEIMRRARRTGVRAMSEYWFARRYPLGNPRNAMAPVHWKGWVMSAVFVAALAAGGVTFAWLGASGRMAAGIGVFVLVAFVATAWFIMLVRANGDRVRTVEDYR